MNTYWPRLASGGSAENTCDVTIEAVVLIGSADTAVPLACLLMIWTVPWNVPGRMPAIAGENGNAACWRDSSSRGTSGISCGEIATQLVAVSSLKQPATFATVEPSSP